MDRRHVVGITLAATAAVGYGIGPLFAKDAYGAGVGWPELIAWRFVVAAALTWGFVVVRPSSRAALSGLDLRRAGAVVATGAVFTINGIAYYAAVEAIPASLAALFMFMYPTFVAVLATRFGHVPAGPRPWTALAVTLVGAVVLIGGVDAQGNAAGIVIGISAPVAYAVYTVLGARIAGERRGVTAVGRSGRSGPDLDSAVAAAFLLTGTALGTLTVTIAVGVHAAPWEISSRAWPGIIGVAVFATAVAMQAAYGGVARIGSSQAAIVSMLEPVSTVILAMLLLRETYGPIQLVGGAIVVVGVIVAVSANRARTGDGLTESSADAPPGTPNAEQASPPGSPVTASLATVPARPDAGELS